MKRVLTALLMLLAAASLFAGGIENKNNMSAGYLRNPSKNTETKKPDAVFYNPAGTAFMEEGLYLELGNQFLFKDYTHDASDLTGFDEYSSVDPVLLYPSGEIVWNGGNFALFGGFGVAAGGGAAEYADGSITTVGALLGFKAVAGPLAGLVETDSSLDLTAIIFGETVGASYAINDMVSVSAALRLIQGKITMKGELDEEPDPLLSSYIDDQTLLDSEATANGFGFVFGLHLKPVEKLDLALQYQTKVSLEYEYDKLEAVPFLLASLKMEEGDTYDKDLPAMLGAGVGYQLLDSLYTSLSFNYYFNKAAAFETGTMGNENEYNDSWEIGAGAEYTLNEMIALSGGVLYSKQGFKDDENSAEVPVLDSVTIGAGAGLTFIEDLMIDIGIFKPIYFDADYESSAGDITLSKKLFLVGISASYKLF